MEDDMSPSDNVDKQDGARRPFIVAGKTIVCARHPDQVATFYCAKCADPYGECCVGCEDGESTWCQTCATEMLALEQPPRLRKTVAILAGLGMMLAVGNLAYWMQSQPAMRQVGVEPASSEEVQRIVACAGKLERVARLIASYHESMHEWPSAIEDLIPLADDAGDLLDPLSREPFEIRHREAGVVVETPAPERYGVARIYARPRQPARVEYLQ
ncbi:MAG: hypothetical protein R8K47_05960 [Mariprofundaceae bacterium]